MGHSLPDPSTVWPDWVAYPDLFRRRQCHGLNSIQIISLDWFLSAYAVTITGWNTWMHISFFVYHAACVHLQYWKSAIRVYFKTFLIVSDPWEQGRGGEWDCLTLSMGYYEVWEHLNSFLPSSWSFQLNLEYAVDPNLIGPLQSKFHWINTINKLQKIIFWMTSIPKYNHPWKLSGMIYGQPCITSIHVYSLSWEPDIISHKSDEWGLDTLMHHHMASWRTTSTPRGSQK